MKVIITNSQIELFKECRLKYKFAYLDLLTPKVPSSKLFLGAGIHEGLKAYYSNQKDLDTAKKSFANYVNTQIKDIENQIELTDEQLEEITQANKLGLSMLEEYDKFAKVQDDFEIVFPEKEFLVPVITPFGHKSTKFMFAGKVDGLVKKNNAYWLMEHKTTSSVSSGYLSNLVLDEQVTAYIWALQKQENIEIVGCIYNIIRKQLPSPKVKNPIVYREQVYRSQKDIADFQTQLHRICLEISHPAIYRHPTDDCSWKCAYRTLCIEDTDEARMQFRIKEKINEELKTISPDKNQGAEKEETDGYQNH
ncbi:MAG: PD-(D/E)XK nuclease family protein [Elusimicrobiota bacterium]